MVSNERSIHLDNSINQFTSLSLIDEQKPMGLKNLPINILLDTCLYLNQYDLYNLCQCSKIWHYPAITTLYTKIIVIDDLNALNTLKKILTKSNKFYGTLISPSSFDKLLTVNHKTSNLALIKSLILNINESTIDLLLPTLELTNNLLNLNSLIAPDIPISFFNHKLNWKTQHINTLAISIKHISVSSCNFEFPNLQKLKIYYNNSIKDGKNLMRFGRSLNSTKSLKNLRELEFVENKFIDRLTMLNILNDGTPESTESYLYNDLPTWIYLFESTSPKLILDSLAIEGYIGSTGTKCVEILDSVIDLSLLCNLQLKIKESSHFNSNHSEFTTYNQFLTLLTSKTINLESLAVNPTSDCLLCQQDSILKSLTRNLNQKLKNLSVVFESSSIQYSQQINDAICNSQQNLQRLLINDKSTEVFDRGLLFKCIKSNQSLISLYEHGLYYENLVVDLLFTDVWMSDFLKLDEEFIVNDQMIQFIQKTSGKGLNEFLWYFLHFAFSPVVASNFKLIGKIPKLKNLNVLGLNLAINYSDGTVNKEMQQLYYVANGNYISSGLTYRK